jgi:uncharacterized DUF497 family protein
LLGASRSLAPEIFRNYSISVRITFDPAKRAACLAHRGLDFADAAAVFAGRHATEEDDRKDYGEPRFITAGHLAGRLVVMVWTPRDGARRIISMRHAHDREARRWQKYLDGPR